MNLAALFRPILAHKKLLLALCLAGGLGTGGFWGWNVWQHRQQPEFAVETFQQALRQTDIHALALCVNFDALTGSLARAFMDQQPESGSQEERFLTLRSQMQQALLADLTMPPEKAKARDENTTAPLYPLPAQFAAQLATNMRFLPRSEGMLLVQTSFRHPAADSPVPVLLLLRKEGGAWKVAEVANAKELVRRFLDARQRQREAKEKAFQEKNEATARRMNSHLRIQSCEVAAALLSDKTTVLAKVTVLARNTGEQTVRNTNLHLQVQNKDGRSLLTRSLNSTAITRPGEDFRQHWTLDLHVNSDEAKTLLQTQPLTCTGTWQNMLLDNGTLLRIQDKI